MIPSVFALVAGKTCVDTFVVFGIETCVKTCFLISQVKDSVRIFRVGLVLEIVEVDDLFPKNIIDVFLEDWRVCVFWR